MKELNFTENELETNKIRVLNSGQTIVPTYNRQII